MNRIVFIIILLILPFSLFSFPFSEVNDYYDYELVPKEGTYGVNRYGKNKSFTGIGGSFRTLNSYAEMLLFTRFYIDLPELYGFFFVADFLVDYKTATNSEIMPASGEYSKSFGVTFTYGGESYIGFQNKYTTIKLGFQNLVSSDAIYNHLLYDDYSGSFFALKWDLLITRFLDIELLYNIVRPQNGLWTTTLPLDSTNRIYEGLYGKSLYSKKINIRPLPWIRLGITDCIYFMGENFNMWFANPFSLYFITASMEELYDPKYASMGNTLASDVKFSFDFNIGFGGWNVYGEMMVDDLDGYYILQKTPHLPDRIGFVIGGEIRGYLFTNLLKSSRIVDYIFGNMYLNFEYAIVSKYTYSRDNLYNYEFVREEWIDPANPEASYYQGKTVMSQADADYINRTGNFIGYMYGPNSDSIDFAIGWRNDLESVKNYRADYQGDIYFDSMKDKKYPNRLFKMQLHYRLYRLGTGRNVVANFYENEHYYFDIDPDLDSDGDGVTDNDYSDRKTEFIRNVKEMGNKLDFSIYTDIFRVSKFVVGLDMNFKFEWRTMYPFTYREKTTFSFGFEFAGIVSW